MTFFPLLASESFGLNFNPLQTNLVNLAIVIGVLVWFLRGFLGGILEKRRSAILQDLEEADQQAVLEAMEPEDRAAIESALAYPEETAGRLSGSSQRDATIM